MIYLDAFHGFCISCAAVLGLGYLICVLLGKGWGGR